ncbi:venom serine protease inhibitor [Drosophila madeirensis]|uniref:Venom serine protease inhibitor n=1 Tax=Drosophila madeirensis TaxID=30013 RepID=A0AAU9EWW6_DROMD
MFVQQLTLRLCQPLFLPLILLLGGSFAAPQNRPCAENEVKTCLLCNEPSCTVPNYLDPHCKYISVCRLGCGCKSGYVRNDTTNRCVSIYDCHTFRWLKHDFRLERLLASRPIL